LTIPSNEVKKINLECHCFKVDIFPGQQQNTMCCHCSNVDIIPIKQYDIDMGTAQAEIENKEIELIHVERKCVELVESKEDMENERVKTEYIAKVAELENVKNRLKSDLWKEHQRFETATKNWQIRLETTTQEFELEAENDLKQLETLASKAEINFKKSKDSDAKVAELKAQVLRLESANASCMKIQSELALAAVEAELNEAQTDEHARRLQIQLKAAFTKLQAMANIAKKAQQRVTSVICDKDIIIEEKNKELETSRSEARAHQNQLAKMASLLATAKQKSSKMEVLNNKVSGLKRKLEYTQDSFRKSKISAELAEDALKLLRKKDSATTLELAALERRLKEKSTEAVLLKQRELQLESKLGELKTAVSSFKAQLEESKRNTAESNDKVKSMSIQNSQIFEDAKILDNNVDKLKLEMVNLQEILRKTRVALRESKETTKLAECSFIAMKERERLRSVKLTAMTDELKEKSTEAALHRKMSLKLKGELEKLAESIGFVKTKLAEKTNDSRDAKEKVKVFAAETHRLKANEKVNIGKLEHLNHKVVDLEKKLSKTRKAYEISVKSAEVAESALCLLRTKEHAIAKELSVMHKRLKEKSDEANLLEQKQMEVEAQLDKLKQTMATVTLKLMEKTRSAEKANKNVEAMSQEKERMIASEKRKARQVEDLNDQIGAMKVKLERTQKSCQESKYSAELAEGALKLLRAKDKAKTLDLVLIETRLKEKIKEVSLLKNNEMQLRCEIEQLNQTIDVLRIELEEKTLALTEAQRIIAIMTEEKSRIVQEWQEKLEKAAMNFKASEQKIRVFAASLESLKQESLKAEDLRAHVDEKLKETMETMKKIREQAASSLKAQCEIEKRAKEEIASIKTIVVERDQELVELRTDMLQLTSAQAQ